MIGALALTGCAKESGGSGGSGGGGAAGCGQPKQAPAAPAATIKSPVNTNADASKMKVGLAFDLGGRGDASFNDAAAAGIDMAVDKLGLPQASTKELTAKNNEDEAAKETRLRQLAGGGYNPVVAVGFAYTDAVAKVAKDYPKVKFALVDSTVEGAKNVTPLLFAEHQGSYLVGVIAALKTKKCHIGFIGGVETPLIKKFEAGYVQGAKTVQPGIKIDIDYLTPLGDNSGFNAPDKAGTSASGMLSKGADVIYPAAGASGIGAFEAVKNSGAQAIGVDSDQYNQPAAAEVKDVIISSMLKRVDVAVFDFIAAVANNDLSQLPKEFDLSVDGVGYAKSGGKIDDITKTVDGYKNAIIAGKIKVADKPQG
jgi:basic membrane protein A